MKKDTRQKLNEAIEAIQNLKIKEVTDEETIGLITTLKVVIEDLFGLIKPSKIPLVLKR